VTRRIAGLVPFVLALCATFAFPWGGVALAEPAPSAAPSAVPFPLATAATLQVAPDLFVRGQLLSTSGGYLVFTNGSAIRLAPDVLVPKGATIGSDVRAVLDQRTHSVRSIELEPHTPVTGEIDVADVPQQYVVVSQRSIPPPPPSGTTIGALAGGLFTVQIDVRVPANTPTSDDVYVSTDRSDYSPAEIKMQRVDARTFTVSIGLAGNTKLRYAFTRGTNNTVERDKTGGIIVPRTLIVAPGTTAHDTVARWADVF
jgi:hypothetical protein